MKLKNALTEGQLRNLRLARTYLTGANDLNDLRAFGLVRRVKLDGYWVWRLTGLGEKLLNSLEKENSNG